MNESRWHWRRPMSIALRMAVWYAVSAFALIFAATGLLYLVLVTNLEQDDVRILADSLNNVSLLLRSAPPGALLPQPEQPRAETSQPQIYVRVLDDRAGIVLETPGMSDELPPPTAAELGSIGRVDRPSREIASRSGKLFQILSARLPGGGADAPARFVEVATTDRDNEVRLLLRYRQWMWLVLVASVVICSLAGYAIARGGIRPIESIGRTAERIRSATLHERIATIGLPAELSSLAGTFNDMLDRLEESFTRISQFSDDVAHELRTPVNNLRGEIEVALSKARSSDDYREILGSCLEECTRISRVIQSLLFLARTESATEALKRDTINVGKELAAVQEFYDAAAAEAGVELRVSVVADIWAPLDRTLFQQAVGNLVSNAIAHTSKGGTVRITACTDASWLEVNVVDTGCGIAAEHLPYLFDRFYRVDQARSRGDHHVGLGLPVVKSIVGRHGGEINIRSQPGAGTDIMMRLPLLA